MPLPMKSTCRQALIRVSCRRGGRRERRGEEVEGREERKWRGGIEDRNWRGVEV